jgi:hypothetical protein
MFRYIMILGFVMTAALSIVYAQESPPPLNSNDVFTANVEVIETLPLWWMDSAALHLYDEVALEWRTYALPVTPDDMPSLVREADNSYTVTLCHPFTFMPYYGADDCTWHLDTTTGEFTLVELVCGGLTTERGEWVVYVSPQTRGSYFCNVQTGELSAELPVDLDLISMTSTPFVVYIVPTGAETNRVGNLIVISVYGGFQTFDLITGETTPLGSIEGATSSHSGVAWVDDTHLIFMTLLGENTTPRRFNLYIADVTQPNSAQLLYSGEAQQLPVLYFRPDTYEWIGSDCTFYELSFDTLEISSSTIDGVCEIGVPIEDGSGDMMITENNSVRRYNPQTGEVHTVFTGDVGCYDYSPSPNGRYENLRFSITERCDELAVLDLQSGEIVYQTRFTFDDGYERWVNGDTLLFYETADDADFLVHPSTGEEISLPHVLSEPGRLYLPFSEDGRWILRQSDEGAVLAYDVITNQTIALTSALTGYNVTARWHTDGTLTVFIENSEGMLLGNWRVRINASVSPPYRMEANQISVYDMTTGEWHGYPFPFESDDTLYAYPNADGTLRIQICFLMGYLQAFQPAECYRGFDPATGEFSTPVSVCGEYLQHERDTRWISIGGVFCNISTGEVSARLPDNFRFETELGYDISPIFPRTVGYPNPTGEWVVFNEFNTLYAFEVHAGILNELGEYAGDAYDCCGGGAVTWLDDTHFTFTSRSIDPSQTYNYVGDITQANSLQVSG